MSTCNTNCSGSELGLKEEVSESTSKSTKTRKTKKMDEENTNKPASVTDSVSRSESYDLLLAMDDQVGRDDDTRTLATRFIDGLRHQRSSLFFSTGVVVAWSCVCAWAADEMAAMARDDPGGSTEQWLSWLGEAGSKFRMIGILFVFAVVFRFNRCYDRWNQGRIILGAHHFGQSGYYPHGQLLDGRRSVCRSFLPVCHCLGLFLQGHTARQFLGG